MILFCALNSVLPFTDVGTDLLTSIGLASDGHYKWAFLTFIVMWNPFFLHLGIFLYDLVTGKMQRSREEVLRRLIAVCWHIPFALPVKNVFRTMRLHTLKFGRPDFVESDWKEVEECQHEAWLDSMYESFTEAGLQSVTQLVIICCTGEISLAQYVSIPISLLNLSWASARAYFIQREKDYSDPDPQVKTVSVHIFPRKLVVVLNSVLLWTIIGSLLGGYVFFGILGCFVTILLGLFLLERNDETKETGSSAVASSEHSNSDEGQENELGEVTQPQADHAPLDQPKGRVSKRNPGANHRESITFKILSSSTSIWLPCVVGSSRYTFLRSAFLSIASKVVLLFVAVLLTYFRAIDTKASLIWCYDVPTAEGMIRAHNATNASWRFEICEGFSNRTGYPGCSSSDDSQLSQKIRVCAPPETENLIRGVLFAIVFASTIAACLASYSLHQLSNYQVLWEKSKSLFCGLVSKEPMVHRSLIFDLAGDDENCEILKDILDVKDLESDLPRSKNQIEEVNRPRYGQKPLDIAVGNGAKGCIKILRKAGAYASQRFLSQLISDDSNFEEVAEILRINLSSGQLPNEAQIEANNNEWDLKSLLHEAVKRESTKYVKLLDMAGAAQNEKDKFLVSYAARGKVISIASYKELANQFWFIFHYYL